MDLSTTLPILESPWDPPVCGGTRKLCSLYSDVIEPPPTFGRKPLVWEEDLELYSKFLDRKEQLRLSHTSYLRQHPEAHALVSDFLLFLLLRRPEDVVTFAAEHFGPFAALRSPIPALRSSHQPSPFRSLEEEEEEEGGKEEEEEELEGEGEEEVEEVEIGEDDDYLYVQEDEEVEDDIYYDSYYDNYEDENIYYDNIYDDDNYDVGNDNVEDDDVDNYDDVDDDDNDVEDDDDVKVDDDHVDVDNDNVDVDNDNINQGLDLKKD